MVQSEQRVCELSQALAHSEEQLSQLQRHSHSQSLQLQKLHEVRVQLNSMMEMNEVGGPLDISLQYCMWWCSLALRSSTFFCLFLSAPYQSLSPSFTL